MQKEKQKQKFLYLLFVFVGKFRAGQEKFIRARAERSVEGGRKVVRPSEWARWRRQEASWPTTLLPPT